jgi:hypothetical protein
LFLDWHFGQTLAWVCACVFLDTLLVGSWFRYYGCRTWRFFPEGDDLCVFPLYALVGSLNECLLNVCQFRRGSNPKTPVIERALKTVALRGGKP